MIKEKLFIKAKKTFAEKYGVEHTIASFAPGRVEVIGNHTDYNEGFVLSSAINYGTIFLLIPNGLEHSRVFCGRTKEEATRPGANDTIVCSTPYFSEKVFFAFVNNSSFIIVILFKLVSSV